MRLADARRFALGLPEATEEPHFDLSSFRVRGKIFATVPPDGRHLRIFVDAEGVHEAVAEDPAACAELRWGQRLSGVEVDLAAARPAPVHELLDRRLAPQGPEEAPPAPSLTF